MSEDLKNYVDKMRKQGFSDEQIRAELKESGWSAEEVNQVMKSKPTEVPSSQGSDTTIRPVLSKKYGKFFLLVIILGAAGGVFAWQYFGASEDKIRTPEKKTLEEVVENETADWEIYRNESYKYKIKYPSDLETAKEEFEKSGVPIETTSFISFIFPLVEDTPVLSSIDIRVIPNTENKLLLSVLDYDSAFCEIEAEQNTFVRISCEGSGMIRTIESAFSIDDRAYIYVVSLVIWGFVDLTGMDFSSEINTYELMLSTFEFIAGEPISPPTGLGPKDSKIAANMNSLGTTAEIYYRENGTYMNFKNGEDAKSLSQEIRNEIGRGPGSIISSDAYCIDILLTDGKTRYCVDSEGRRGENLGCSRTELICITY